jgi:hypothetical protein
LKQIQDQSRENHLSLSD